MRTTSSEANRGRHPRSGIAAVEMAITMPVIITLLFGMLEVGRMVQINQILCNAAREGARTASTGLNTYADVQTTVQNYLTNAGVTNQNKLSISVANLTQSNAGPTYDPSTAAWLDQLQVIVTIPYSNVQLSSLLFLNKNTQITATAVWFSNQDQAFPSSVTAPSGS
jgi:Flp pilus assembly protein TadG